MTDFESIYCLNTTITGNRDLANKPEYIFFNMSWNLLKAGLGFCFTIIKDTTFGEITEPITKVSQYTGDGVDKEFGIPFEIPENASYYVGIKRPNERETTEVAAYTISDDASTLTLATAPEPDTLVTLAVYKDGCFEKTLTYSQKIILAESMTIAYLEKYRNNSDSLKQTTYGSSRRMYSQANHIKSIQSAVNEEKKYVRRMLINNSYVSQDDLSKMAGRSD